MTDVRTASRAPAAPAAGSFSRRKRWMARFRLAGGLCLLLYVLFLANVVAFRHPLRVDWTEEGLRSLSQRTRDTLALVREEILVVIPTYGQRDNPELVAYLDVLARARQLLNEYCAIQPLVKIAAEVNVFDRPDRWLEVKERFDLDASQVNRFLFFAGGSKELRQAVTPQDLAAFGPSRDPAIAMPRIKAFRGEEAITGAIVRLIERRKRPVYFTQGHGELALRPEEARAAGPAGLSAFLHELRTVGLEPRELSLGISRDVPDDCALLVVAAPDQAYSREELGAIDRYLQKGGRLFAVLGPARGTAFDDLLAAWGARALEGRLEARKSLPGGGHIYVPRVPVRAFHKAHPATRVFESVPRFEMYLENARPIASGGAEKGLESTPLIEVVSREGEGYYLVSDRKDPELPKPGDFELAVAVEQRAPERPPPGFRRLGTRIVVAGSPSFLRDQSFLTGSHRDFTMNCIAWLLGEEDRVTVGGQEWAERMIKASPGIQRFLFWVPVFLLPGIFLCIGAFVYYLRRT